MTGASARGIEPVTALVGRLGLAALGVALLGCPARSAEPTAVPDSQAPNVSECAAHDPFPSLAWVPSSAEAVVVLDTAAPDFDAALAQLTTGARDPERKLPIRVAFAFGQWGWQVPLLRSTLARAGFAPRQLVHLTLRDGDSAWAWPPSCDLETVATNLELAWGSSLRSTPYGAVAVASRGPDGTATFAYDFVALGASAYALVPAGRAHAVAAQLDRRGPDSGPNPGTTAEALQPAPLRAVVQTRALVTPGVDVGTEAQLATHRIDANGWSSASQ